ncbi:MAG: HD-GYP domain-containing protein [Heliobacteriaceae bacterium]|nr:HD-GYP domain-containing protein [Heliobacteriaceae bacterium]MDD4588333.1 HD-GYP domain-containing protein [Heliobacteriaceae bacterium]
MRKVSLKNTKPGMILARGIYNPDGRTLLGAGITLTDPFIARLKELQIPAVFIKDKIIGDLTVPEIINIEVRNAAIKKVRDSFHRVQLSSERRLDTDQIKTAVADLIDEVLRNRNVMFHIADIRTFDDYTFGHSVNVSILSVLTGIALGYNQLQLYELALGAILHDVGKMLVPVEILNKPGELTPEEYEEIVRHCKYGFEILRQHQDEVSLLAAHVAYQHQERYDGSGYPRHLKGTEIHEYARIVAVADIYDALVADRVYRKGYLPYQAYEIILIDSAQTLDPHIAQVFLQNIAIYPVGSVVRLNTGEYGVVVDVNKFHQSRPVIRVMFTPEGKHLDVYQEVDLTRHLTIFIDWILTEEEVNQLVISSDS